MSRTREKRDSENVWWGMMGEDGACVGLKKKSDFFFFFSSDLGRYVITMFLLKLRPKDSLKI